MEKYEDEYSQSEKDIKSLFVTYEMALKLYEKGFNEYCIVNYDNKKLNNYPHPLDMGISNIELKRFNKNNSITAPLYQQVVEWFDKKKILIIPEVQFILKPKEIIWTVTIINLVNDYNLYLSKLEKRIFNSRTECIIAAIEYLLTDEYVLTMF